MMILVVTGLCAVLLVILGLFMRRGKGLMFLSAYRRMPQAQRDTINKWELSRVAGNLTLRTAIVVALMGVAMYFELSGWVTFALIAVIIADSCYFSLRLYRRTIQTMPSKIRLAISIVISVVVFVAVGVLFYNGEKEPSISIQDNSIHIEGMYGLDIDISQVKDISLIDKSMKDIGPGYRSNGYGGLGDTLKGHFRSKDIGDILLFVKSQSSPTIWIQRDGGEDIYISFGDAEKTKTLHQELTAQ